MYFYQRLKDLREDEDKKQTEIADLLKIGLSTYARYEQGKLKIPLDNALDLAEFYNVSLDYIAGRTNDKRGLTRSELSSYDTDILKKIHLLSEEKKGRMLERLETLLEEQEKENAQIKGVI